jgi:hypothetical protein
MRCPAGHAQEHPGLGSSLLAATCTACWQPHAQPCAEVCACIGPWPLARLVHQSTCLAPVCHHRCGLLQHACLLVVIPIAEQACWYWAALGWAVGLFRICISHLVICYLLLCAWLCMAGHAPVGVITTWWAPVLGPEPVHYWQHHACC